MISVVTVNYKTKDYLLRMLDSLFLHHSDQEVEVVVVENCSGDDLSAIQNRFPKVMFVFNTENVGFAQGCNIGIAKSKGDYVILINPDILFTSPSLFQIEKKMDQEPEVGIGGVSLKNMDGSQQSCVWRFPTACDQIAVLLKLHHPFPQIPCIRRWLMNDFDYTMSQNVDQVMGAFFCIRRELLNTIGLLDRGFFMWYEEVDFCKRAKNAGWIIKYFADIDAKHKKSSSFDMVATYNKQKMLRRSIRRYMFKHHGLAVYVLFVLFEPVFVVTSFAASVIKPM